jgi:hypothetical protein
MVYLFKVYALVSAIVFTCSGALMLAMFGWQQAREYSRARLVMHRIAKRTFREPIAISRNGSRFHEENPLRLA